MFKNFIKIAWRNLWASKAFSLINIAGLALGMLCTLLIFLWVYNERSWDKSNKHYSNIYHVLSNRNFNGEITTGPDMMYPLAKAIDASLPEVEQAAIVSFGEQTLFTVGDKKIKRSSITTSPQLFHIFTFELLHGKADVLNDPSSLVLTKATALALFGRQDVVGETVQVNNNRTLTVNAVVADLPRNATLQAEAILPFNTSSPQVKEAEQEWVNCNNRVFVKTHAGADVTGLAAKIHGIIKSHTREPNPTTRGNVLLHPMKSWRLYEEFTDGKNTGGRIQYVNLFTAIALVILLIACINFMNLSTARAGKRAMEIGIRKTLGSDKGQLARQFLTESMLLSLIAFLFSLLALVLLRPMFSTFLEVDLLIPFNQPLLWIALFSLLLVTGLVAGSYPAIYLAAFNPVKVLKGSFRGDGKGAMPRKVLVTLQFIVSIVMISATLIIYQQIQYIKQRDIGYDPNNMLMVPSSAASNKNFAAIKNELMQSGLVEAVMRTSSPVTDLLGFTSGIEWTGAPKNTQLVIGFFFADNDFVKTMHARMIEGRDFQAGDTNRVLFNKEAIRLMGISSPVGKTINWAGRVRTITGVMDNLVVGSPYEVATPLMVAYEHNWSGSINIRLAAGANVRKALNMVELVYKKHSPDYPFEYHFVNEALQLKLVNEKMIGTLAVIFAGLAIFICCLGLFGLVSFTIERRNREISIRKVMGASVQQLLVLMSKEFLVLVAIAFFIALPAAWWAMYTWLQNFNYRIDINVGVFIIVGVAMLLLTWLTVGLNASRAALNKPVNTLRM